MTYNDWRYRLAALYESQARMRFDISVKAGHDEGLKAIASSMDASLEDLGDAVTRVFGDGFTELIDGYARLSEKTTHAELLDLATIWEMTGKMRYRK